jgi:ring-1,2-phenylacetyl-CoA epoxidase subunit PaaC
VQIGRELDGSLRAVLREYVLTVADDELVLGHRDSEWCAFAPLIEEDVAFASIAQDEIAHAALLYGLLEEPGGSGADAIAFGRPPQAMRNAVLVERPNADWAYSVARHFVYDVADDLRTADLLASREPLLRSVAERMRREERYHLEHGRTWLNALALGGHEAALRLQHAVDRIAADSFDLFRPLAWEGALVRAGILPEAPSHLWARFVERVQAELAPLGLQFTPPRQAPRGRTGEHLADLAQLLDEMGEVWRSDPNAVW